MLGRCDGDPCFTKSCFQFFLNTWLDGISQTALASWGSCGCTLASGNRRKWCVSVSGLVPKGPWSSVLSSYFSASRMQALGVAMARGNWVKVTGSLYTCMEEDLILIPVTWTMKWRGIIPWDLRGCLFGQLPCADNTVWLESSVFNNETVGPERICDLLKGTKISQTSEI